MLYKFARRSLLRPLARHFATPANAGNDLAANVAVQSAIAAQISKATLSIPFIYNLYHRRAGHVLDKILPIEPTPHEQRRICVDDHGNANGIVLIAHYAEQQEQMELVMCSGFAIDGSPDEGRQSIVTCAHTLEQASLFESSPSALLLKYSTHRFIDHHCLHPTSPDLPQ